MFAGHYAAAFGLKAAVPRAPTWALLVAMALSDLTCSVFLLAGLEGISPDPRPPGFRLEIDWSHSLATTFVWGVLFALPFLRRGRAVALALLAAALSHFVLDAAVHGPDMALYPHGARFGLGLWHSAPVGSWVLELALVLAAVAAYARRGRREGSFAARPYAVLAILLVLHLAFSPWARALMLPHG